jgi:hypothetical protein
MVLCIACPPAAPIIIPIFILLAVLQLICGIIQAAAMASARRRLRERLAAELMERQRIEAETKRRSEFLRLLDHWPQKRPGRVASRRAISAHRFIVTNMSRPAENVVDFYKQARHCDPRFAVAQDARRDDPRLTMTRNPGNVG